MLRLDENPIVPAEISTKPNTQLARPTTDFTISLGPERDAPGSDRAVAGPPCRDCGAGSAPANDGENAVVARDIESTPPPPVRKPQPPREISLGVINGKATDLPIPPFPAAAKAVGSQGKVDVQVTIDESGRVISAKAASGHPLLRPAAEKAAWQARFTPTFLSKVPVKVTGVIVYNFTR
jgi:TonB family protein